MTGPALAAPGVALGPEALIAQRGHVLRRGAVSTVSALPGGFAIRRRGHGQVVADSRAYVQGDDIRHLDRGATARTGTPHIRTFHEERDRVTFLVADFRPAMLWGMRRAFRSVAAAEALARLGWQAVESGGRVGLLAISAAGSEIVPTRGRTAGMLAVIGGMVRAHARALAAARDGLDDMPLDRALAGLPRVAPRGSAVVIASGLDVRGPGFDALLGALAQHRAPRLLIVEDRALDDLPPGYYPTRRADGGGMRGLFRGASSVGPVPAPAEHTSLRMDAGAPVSDAVLALGD